MKSYSTTITMNAMIALAKMQSAYAALQLPDAWGRALVPLVAAILLIVACVLISKHRSLGPIIALGVIGFFLVQFFLLGTFRTLLVYFALHLLAFMANTGAFLALRQAPPPRL